MPAIAGIFYSSKKLLLVKLLSVKDFKNLIRLSFSSSVILNPVINSNSVWKAQALKFIGDYYYSTNQFKKAKQY